MLYSKAKSSSADQEMLQDALTTMKYSSSLFDTAVMECSDDVLRSTLRNLQTEHQDDAKKLYDIMNKKGWYGI